MSEINKELIPKGQIDFEQRFSTEEKCIKYLMHLKYKNGNIICKICGSDSLWRIDTYRYKCSKCSEKNSILEDTIFEGKKRPLMSYYRAIWEIINTKNGTNAKAVESLLGITYKSSWLWLQKIRRAMITLERKKLSGKVEVDEAQFGKTTNKKRGRGTDQLKLILAVELVENINKKGKLYITLGRIRIRMIEDFSADSLEAFIVNNIEIGSVVITDDWNGYNGILQKGYIREIQNAIEKNETGEVALPHVHLIISLLKRWVLGTLQGSYSSKYFDYYLDEFVFRFNRRNSKDRGLLFYRLLEVAVAKERNTLAEIKREKRADTDQNGSP